MGSVSKWWKTSAAESTPGSSDISFMRVTMSASLSVSSVTTSLPPELGVELDPRHVGQGCADLGQVFGANVEDQARNVRLSDRAASMTRPLRTSRREGTGLAITRAPGGR